MEESILDVEELEVNYRTSEGLIRVLDRVSLSLKRGEILGVVGESGCGKSTLAHTILRVVPSPPAEIVHGKVIFMGQDLLRMDERELNSKIRGKKIAFIPQDPLLSLSPVFTIGQQFMDVMAHNYERDDGKKKSKDEMKREIIELLKQVEIPSPETQLNKYPHELSGGQNQRVLIAMALSSNPSFLIADEPTTALDVSVQAQILRLIKKLVKDRGLSVLYVTHDLGVVAKICDRVAVMYAGQIVEITSVRDLFEKPPHPYTELLLSAVPSLDKDKLEGIPGTVPNLINPPSGCRFRTRCPYVMPKCETKPKLEQIVDGHKVACFRY